MKIRDIVGVLLENRPIITRYDRVIQDFGQKLKQAASKDTFYRGGDDAASIVAQLKTIDPAGGKNITWLAKMYAAGKFRMEDADRIGSAIRLFAANRARLDVQDLNAYRDVATLYTAVEPFIPKQQLDPEYEQFLSKTRTDGAAANEIEELSQFGKQRILIKTPNFLVTVPLDLSTSRAFCKLHGQTEWCTTGSDNFENYSSQGPLYDLFVKKGNKLRKFQFHVETSQYKNEKDDDLTASEIKMLSAIPEYTKFLNYLIKKHYGKYLDAE